MLEPGAWLRRVTPLSGDEQPDFARSDLDIAILPDRLIDPWDRHERAAQVASRIGRDVDLVDLRRVSSVLRFEVVARGWRVAARDPWACRQAIDMANRATFPRKLDIADDTAAVFVNLGRAGLIPAVLAESLRRMVGFSNVVVHELQALDLDKVRSIIELRRDDLLAFSKAMLRADPGG